MELRGILPARWQLPGREVKCEVEIIVNWLDLELPRPAPLPTLDVLSGWRNREVYTYIQSYDWMREIM